MRPALRAGGRRESAMAEAAAGAGGSPGPAAAPAPRGSAGPQENEQCPGGPSPESGEAAPDPDSAAKAAGAEESLDPPSPKRTPSSPGGKERAASSPGQPPPLASFSLSPIIATPRGQRRSWRRSSLTGRRSRRKSLPPLQPGLAELSKSISLELPEIQRLSLLLLSSFQFSAQKLKKVLEESEGFDPEAFAAKVQVGSEEFQRLIQRLIQDGTLGNCLEQPPGDSLDPALEESVAQVKVLMGSFSGELQAWDQLLQQHLQHSQEASRNLEQLRAGTPPWAPPQIPKSQILDSKPDYGKILTQQKPVLESLRLLVDEAQQAGKILLEFHRESRNFLTGLSQELASRTFRKLPGSPARRLLERKPQRALPAGGE